MSSALLLLADGRFPAGGHAHSSGLETAVATGKVTTVSTLESFLLGRLHTTGLVAAAFAACSHAAVSFAAAHAPAASAAAPAASAPAPAPASAAPAASFHSGATSGAAAFATASSQNASAAVAAGAVGVGSSAAAGGEDAGSAVRLARGGVDAGSAVRLARGGVDVGSEAMLVRLDEEYEARVPSPAARLASRKQGAALLRAARIVWPWEGFGFLPQRRDGAHHAVVLGVTAAAAGLTCGEAALVACYSPLTGQASAALRLLGFSPYDIQRLLARLAPQCDSVAMAATAFAGKDPADLPMFSSPLADISAEIHATWEVRLFAS